MQLWTPPRANDVWRNVHRLRSLACVVNRLQRRQQLLYFLCLVLLSLRSRRSKGEGRGGEGRGNSGAAEPIKNLVTSGKPGRRSQPKYCLKKSIQVVISFAVFFGFLVFCKCTTIVSMQILFVPNLLAGYLFFFFFSEITQLPFSTSKQQMAGPWGTC